MDKRKVLVVDDEKLLVKSTCMVLKTCNYEARGVMDGEECLRTAMEFRPDIILLDIMMPGMDGWEVLEKLREKEELRGIPVIVFTAREYSNGREMAREKGAVDYIAKPFELEELDHLIRKALDILEAR